MSDRRLVIAGASSGVGKTTVTIGLMAALKAKGLNVQGFKCGPDYIDPAYHTAVTGRTSRNLDSWMLDESMLNHVLQSGADGADISLIEGVMGLYDGKDPLSDKGSTAHISLITRAPVILVVDCSALARSAAAIVKGFQNFNRSVNLVGVIANRVASQGHYELVEAAVEQMCEIPVVGYLPQEKTLNLPERHLGLLPALEKGHLNEFITELAQFTSETVDLTQLYDLAKAPSLIETAVYSSLQRSPVPKVKLAIAKDKAFNFYYIENFELLERAGAELVFFSPLAGEALPTDVDGLYLGGGFPEEFAAELAALTDVKRSINEAIESGMPTLAECGGFMYLCEALETTDGQHYPMVGIIKGKVTMSHTLQAIGYRQVTAQPGNFLLTKGETLRGHEFHYSSFKSEREQSPAFSVKSSYGGADEGIVRKNLIAGYTHLHFGSCPKAAEHFVKQCEEWKVHD
ncbi:cobyrinate a,c-diamide synthase [Salipaludibacillus agaradhaerens]|uniref:cobyrinate a,c-diamide synthase n=1 Tax=Salipaludibacillus agaradhaerens TaxID=76935 RepID=UPI000998ADFB|nr:cobyrinate a,c-diamide synthase [Salipaludibacillus agaradhaerens]